MPVLRSTIQILLFVVTVYYLSGRFNGPDIHKLELLGVHGSSESLRLLINRVVFVVFFVNFIRAPEHVRMIYVLALAFMVVSALTGIQSVLRGGAIYGYRATTRGGAGSVGGHGKTGLTKPACQSAT